MKRLACLLLLFGTLSACGPSGESGASKAPAVVDPEIEKGAIRHFQRFISACEESQVRCLWFQGEKVGEGIEMILDTVRQTSITAEDTHLRPLKGSPVQDIGPEKAAEVTRLLAELPQSDAGVDFARGHHVAFWAEGKRVERVYTQAGMPRALQRIYEIGGGKAPGK
jgi:hypothetical protein